MIDLLYDSADTKAKVSPNNKCREKFRNYLLKMVVARTEDTDNALKKFFKAMLVRFSERSNEAYLTSNITDIIAKLT